MTPSFGCLPGCASISGGEGNRVSAGKIAWSMGREVVSMAIFISLTAERIVICWASPAVAYITGSYCPLIRGGSVSNSDRCSAPHRAALPSETT
jgi:hypothetical protein